MLSLPSAHDLNVTALAYEALKLKPGSQSIRQVFLRQTGVTRTLGSTLKILQLEDTTSALTKDLQGSNILALKQHSSIEGRRV